MRFEFKNELCLYVGSMTEYHGEGKLSGPFEYDWKRVGYQFTPNNSDRPVLTSPNLSSFVINNHGSHGVGK